MNKQLIKQQKSEPTLQTDGSAGSYTLNAQTATLTMSLCAGGPQWLCLQLGHNAGSSPARGVAPGINYVLTQMDPSHTSNLINSSSPASDPRRDGVVLCAASVVHMVYFTGVGTPPRQPLSQVCNRRAPSRAQGTEPPLPPLPSGSQY